MPLLSVPFRAYYEHPDYDNRMGVALVEDCYERPQDPGIVTPGTGRGRTDDSITWEPPASFHARLEVLEMGYKRVRVVDRENARWYSLFPTDFVEMVKRFDVRAGVIDGTFKFVKKGNSYGIQAA